MKLALKVASPRLSAVSDTHQGDGLYIGPVFSRKRARVIIDASETAVQIAQHELDDCKHDCSVAQVARGLTDDHEILLAPLPEHIRSLAHQERFEETVEILCVSGWLAANASDIRLEAVTGILAEPTARIDPFKSVGQPSVGGHQRLQFRERPTIVDRC